MDEYLASLGSFGSYFTEAFKVLLIKFAVLDTNKIYILTVVDNTKELTCAHVTLGHKVLYLGVSDVLIRITLEN